MYNEYIKIKLSYSIFLAFIASSCFIFKNVSLWDWPSLDIGTFYVNLVHPDWLKSDFLTQSMTSDNGRIIFARLTSWPILLGADWYKTLYSFNFLNFMLLPPSLFLGLTTLLPNKNLKSITFVFITISLITFFENDFISYTTTAWWTAFSHRFHPSFISITPLFFGIHFLYKESGNIKNKIFGSGLTVFSFIIHPVYALGGSMFLGIIAVFSKLNKEKIFHFSAIIGSLILSKYLFPSAHLDAIDYYQCFPALQPEHFLPSYFQALGNFPWWLPFLSMEFILLASAVVFFKRKQYNYVKISLAFFSFFILCLAFQYLFIEKFPIFKTIVLISPSRFLAHLPWACLFIFALLIEVKKVDPIINYFDNKLCKMNYINFLKRVSFRNYLFINILSISCFYIYGIMNHCDSENYLDLADKEVIHWIKKNALMKRLLLKMGG
jgi:hypothetical protein